MAGAERSYCGYSEVGTEAMIQYILALILTIITVLVPHTQPSAGCVSSAGVDIPADLATAQAGSRCLELPAGVFSIAPAAGDWLSVTVANVEIRGAGAGLTVILTTGITLTNNLYLIALRAPNAYVHDLSLAIGTGYKSTYEVGGILASVGAFHSRVERIEISGGYTGNGGNGFGIGLYQPYDQNGGNQYTTIQDNYIHDGPATGIGVNGSANLLLNNHIARVGTNSFQHGFYAQGGNNLYQGNIVESVSGYSFHGHKQVPSLDGSGDRYIGNLSLNPGTAHIVINSNGSPPLTRYATISGNTFRNTAGKRSANAVWCNGVPCLIEGNTLEDTYTTTGSGWIEDSGGSVITGNILTTLTAPDGAINMAQIRVTGVGSIVEGNKLTNTIGNSMIKTSGSKHRIVNNVLLHSGPSGDALNLSGDALFVSGNYVESTGGAYTLATSTPLTNLFLTQNYLKRTGDLCNLNLTGVTGRIRDNFFDGTFRYAGAAPGLIQ